MPPQPTTQKGVVYGGNKVVHAAAAAAAARHASLALGYHRQCHAQARACRRQGFGNRRDRSEVVRRGHIHSKRCVDHAGTAMAVWCVAASLRRSGGLREGVCVCVTERERERGEIWRESVCVRVCVLASADWRTIHWKTSDSCMMYLHSPAGRTMNSEWQWRPDKSFTACLAARGCSTKGE